MSVLGKKWIIKNQNSKQTLLEKLLHNRGLIEQKQIKTFFDPAITDLYSPFLMNDMRKAVDRIRKAIKDEERVIIYGDYDVDGITGTTILVRALKKLGANVSYRLPHRIEDGYGLHEKFVNEFKELGIKLLITVDCGISCVKEVDLANEHGIDVIIADHHTIPEKAPNAYAILHPKHKGCLYPFKDLTGAGVALKLAYGLFSDEKDETKINPYAAEFLDLASLGTVADLGSLLDENRLIVKYGLERLKHSKWKGIQYLKQYSGISPDEAIDTFLIGYRLAPRINAAGRIAHPYYALKLLLEDENANQADAFAKALEGFNTERQRITEKAIAEAEEMFAHDISGSCVLIAHSKLWHSGIIGLIAGKLMDKYKKPAFVMSEGEEALVGSVRAPAHFDAVKAITHVSEYLDHFGGHAAAAGFTIKKKNLENFSKALEEYSKHHMKNCDLTEKMEIEAEMHEEDISEETYTMLAKFQPFGIGNPEPIFMLKKATISNISLVGKNKDHAKFSFFINKKKIDGIGFHLGRHMEKISMSEPIDLVYTLQKNNFNGRSTLQLNVVDLTQAV